jgi:hypothetical protein
MTRRLRAFASDYVHTIFCGTVFYLATTGLTSIYKGHTELPGWRWILAFMIGGLLVSLAFEKTRRELFDDGSSDDPEAVAH